VDSEDSENSEFSEFSENAYAPGRFAVATCGDPTLVGDSILGDVNEEVSGVRCGMARGFGDKKGGTSVPPFEAL